MSQLNYEFHEILVNVDELAEKELNLSHMTRRLIEIENEHEYKLKRQEETYAEKIKELEEGNANAVQMLKKRIQVSVQTYLKLN